MPRNVLTALICGSLLTGSALAGTVPDDPTQIEPLPVGATAPAFVAREPDGSDYRFDAGPRSAPALVIFYRGGWCPYCNAHLAELRGLVPQLKERGFDVLFLSADRPRLLHSSLKSDIPEYTLLSDARMQAARAFGIAFRVDDATFARYRSLGLDLESASGEKHHELPVPAVFLIDRRGVIRFVYANPDYKIRLSADELRSAVDRFLSTDGA